MCKAMLKIDAAEKCRLRTLDGMAWVFKLMQQADAIAEPKRSAVIQTIFDTRRHLK
jgi:hypothetical protein